MTVVVSHAKLGRWGKKFAGDFPGSPGSSTFDRCSCRLRSVDGSWYMACAGDLGLASGAFRLLHSRA